MTQERIEKLKQDLLLLNIELRIREYNKQVVEKELYTLTHLPENNVFFDLQTACETIEDKLYGEVMDVAHGCKGKDKYKCGFTVGDKEYEGVLEVEWNRYDKQYYYEDGVTFSFKELEK